MSTPPAGPGSFEPDGAAHHPGHGQYAAGPAGAASPYGSPELVPAGNPYTGEPTHPTHAPPSSRRGLGWAGVIVLYGLAVWQLVVPTVAAFVQSTSSGNPVTGSGESVGLQNWADVMPQLLPALGFGILLALPVTVVAAVLGLVIGAAMAPQQALATPVRIGVGVLGAVFVPLGIGVSRFVASGGFASPEEARSFVLVCVTLAGLPLLTAGFATAFAAALGSRAPGRGVAAVLVLGVTGALTLGPQLLDVPLLFTGGGPNASTETPMLQIYRLGFQMMDFGRGSAVAGVVLLLAGLLGIMAVLALLLTRVRLGLAGDAAPRPAGAIGVLGAVVAGLALIGALALLLPVLLGGLVDTPPEISSVRTGLTTWAPAALGTLLQVAVAVLGGAAIGWCRPVGHGSLWLLLPLAPWLFVGAAPLMLQRFNDAQALGMVNTWLGAVPGPVVVVGAVVVFALLFAGLREGSGRAAGRALGAATAGTAAVLLVIQGQSLLPALAVSTDPALASAPMTVLRYLGMFGYRGDDVGWLTGLLYPLPMVLLVVALGVVAQLGLRRVVMLPPE